MGMVLLFLGLIVAFVGGIWLLIEAFKVSVWWGLGYLFLPFVSLIFVIVHFKEAKNPFLICIAGTAVMVIGMMLAPDAIQSR